MIENSQIAEKIMTFGLTRQEALIYITLYTDGALTGYEVSKITGISRSNAYNSLAGLVEQGAAYVIESKVTKYTAVPIVEFCQNKIRRLNEEKEYLINHMPNMKTEAEGYITITGKDHVLDKMISMIRQAEYRIYISISAGLLELVKEELAKLLKQGKKVVIITDCKTDLLTAEIHYANREKNQFRLITDSSRVLTGELLTGGVDTALYSGQQNFVNVFKEALSNEIKLIDITKGDI